MYTEVDHREVRELDRRSCDGIDVTLLWSARTDTVFVAVENARTDEAFRLNVEPAEALDAFHHPYAYRLRRGRSPASRPPRRGESIGLLPASGDTDARVE